MRFKNLKIVLCFLKIESMYTYTDSNLFRVYCQVKRALFWEMDLVIIRESLTNYFNSCAFDSDPVFYKTTKLSFLQKVRNALNWK